jgi:hypothetical protein
MVRSAENGIGECMSEKSHLILCARMLLSFLLVLTHDATRYTLRIWGGTVHIDQRPRAAGGDPGLTKGESHS